MQNGRTAIVTGASRGIGRAIALSLAREGASVAVIYNGSEQKADEVCALIKDMGGNAKPYKCDVGDFTACETTVAAITAELGAPDILVNNAGITRDGLLMRMTPGDFNDVITTNLTGAFNMTRCSCVHMIRKRYGRIINITSVSGLMGNAGQVNYSAAKAGIVGLTKSTAKELASRNITCNAIAPGFIQTDMTDALPAQAVEAAKLQIPLKRFGTPEDIAAIAVFLASDAAGYITGEIIKSDGGLYI